MNEALNGIPLPKEIHMEGMVHAAYNEKIRVKLLQIETTLGNNLTPPNAKAALTNLLDDIRTAIINNPNVNLNNINF